MPTQVIRPSMKTVKAVYVFVLVIIIAVAAYVLMTSQTQLPPWIAAVPLVLLIWPLNMQLGRSFTKLTVDGVKLRYERGFLSKSTRNLDLRKVQDVRVDQSLGQRMLGTGDLAIETAGETSRLVMHAIDRPHQIAEAILEAARADSPRTHGL